MVMLVWRRKVVNAIFVKLIFVIPRGNGELKPVRDKSTGCSAGGSASLLGSEGRSFEYCHPDNMDQISEPIAKAILQAAINESRASALLSCLFDGGSATVDAQTGKLVLMSANMLQALCHDDTEI